VHDVDVAGLAGQLDDLELGAALFRRLADEARDAVLVRPQGAERAEPGHLGPKRAAYVLGAARPAGALAPADRVDEGRKAGGDERSTCARLDPVDAQEELHAGQALDPAGRGVVEMPHLVRQHPSSLGRGKGQE
jgi:hypothetical protein